MTEPLREALRSAAERIHGNESHPATTFAVCNLEPCSEHRAALAASPERLGVERLARAITAHVNAERDDPDPHLCGDYCAGDLYARLTGARP